MVDVAAQMAELDYNTVNVAVNELLGGLVQRADSDLLAWVVASIHTELNQSPALTTEQLINYIGIYLGSRGLDLEHIGEGFTVKQFAEDLLRYLKPKLDQVSLSKGLERLDSEVVIEKNIEDTAFEDPFLGIKLGQGVNFNAATPMDELLDARKIRQKERERSIKSMKEWERSSEPWPTPIRIHGSNKQRAALTDTVLSSFTLAVSGRPLLQNADLKICLNRKYGLIGRNGIGKSTLLKGLVNKTIGIDKTINIACLEQNPEFPNEQTCLDAVLAVDQERTILLNEAANLENTDPSEIDEERVLLVYNRLADIRADEAPKLAKELLTGLGLHEDQIYSPVKTLSGGWRMRVSLARALFSEPDILLLDEPTNHLDLHAVSWLTKYINKRESTFVIVSHARDFLNDTCTDVIEFKNMKLFYYKGDYDTYERIVSDREMQQTRAFESQQARTKHDQKFIDRFRAKASKASSVQSRIKQLAKLPKIEAISQDPNLVFHFAVPDKLSGGSSVIKIKHASAAYPSNPTNVILQDVNLSIDTESRIAICGSNGSGKTTLLKLITGELVATSGEIEIPLGMKIGYFSQHHVDSLDLSLSAVNSLIWRFSTADHEISMNEARSYLGRFGVSGSLALEPLFILSGGQKSRVALALCVYDNPQILILDEPTNHFDVETVQALIAALNEYEGGVILVSHDAFLLSCCADDVYHVETSDKSVTKFPGSFTMYKKLLLRAGPRVNPLSLLSNKKIVAMCQGD